MPNILAEANRVLAPGGLILHIEQPQYSDEMPLFEQFMRDWDAFNNNEPFWSDLHELVLPQEMIKAGFEANSVFEAEAVAAGFDQSKNPEDFGRAPKWYLVGARLGQIMNSNVPGGPNLRSVN